MVNIIYNMKLSYIINFLMSIIIYYIYNQLTKLKKSIKNINTDMMKNNELMVTLNNKIDDINISSSESSIMSNTEENVILNDDEKQQIKHFLDNEKK